MAEKDKKYYWLKLKRDFFKRHDIQIIENMPNGKDYILFYLKLLCESVDHEGNLRFSEEIPYNEDMLAALTHTNIDIVRSAVKLFVGLRMIDIMDDGTFFMNQVQKMIGSETYWAQKKRESKERKALEIGDVGNFPMQSNDFPMCPSKSIEIDIEKDKDIEKENDISHNDSLDESFPAPQQKTNYQQIVDLFNSICTSFPSVRSLSDARKKAIKARLNTYTVDDFKQCFENAEASSFLKGGNNRNWTATFDWLIKDQNMAKVLDGNYNDAKDVSNSSLNNVDEFVTAALSRGFEDLVVDGWNKKEQPKTAADDESIKARAEALKQQFAGK